MKSFWAVLLAAVLFPFQVMAGQFTSKEGAFSITMDDGWKSSKKLSSSVVLQVVKGTSLVRVSRLPGSLSEQELRNKALADLATLKGKKAKIIRGVGKVRLRPGPTLYYIDFEMKGKTYHTGYFSLNGIAYALLMQNTSRKDNGYFARTIAKADGGSGSPVSPPAPVKAAGRAWVRIRDTPIELPVPEGMRADILGPELIKNKIRLLLRNRENQAIIVTALPPLEQSGGVDLARKGVARGLENLKSKHKESSSARCQPLKVESDELLTGWLAVYGALDCPGSSNPHRQSSIVVFSNEDASYSMVGIGFPLEEALAMARGLREIEGVEFAALESAPAVSEAAEAPAGAAANTPTQSGRTAEKIDKALTILNFSPIFLLLLGYLAGRFTEKAHYKSIHAREKKWLTVPVVTCKTLDDTRPIMQADLVSGSVVVSIDYYKRFLSSFRKIFGGEMKSYSPLIDRGRREALLRMKESAPNADAFINCRLETATISKGKNNKATGTVEIFAYSTAVVFQK